MCVNLVKHASISNAMRTSLLEERVWIPQINLADCI